MKPAIERAERLKADLPGAPGGSDQPLGARPARTAASSGPPGEPGSPEHKSACVGAYMRVQGLSRERAEAQYESQLAEYRTTTGV